ncbi:hypothetical protein ABZ297_34410 [Nonomuraea sp. NPDC005983]|uniref:hypothetical protein n=1 Tax=Nonomuraea sp. NPDC005983 TaxID=3155595 RepID=UPI0033BE9D33
MDGVVAVEGDDGVDVVVGPAVLPGVGEALGGCAGVHGVHCGVDILSKLSVGLVMV